MQYDYPLKDIFTFTFFFFFWSKAKSVFFVFFFLKKGDNMNTLETQKTVLSSPEITFQLGETSQISFE